MLFSWFDTRAVSEFARAATEDYCALRGPVGKRQAKGLDRASRLEVVQRRIAEFSSTQRLNTFKRAKLVADLRAGLLEKGVPGDEVTEFIAGVVLRSAKLRRQREA